MGGQATKYLKRYEFLIVIGIVWVTSLLMGCGSKQATVDPAAIETSDTQTIEETAPQKSVYDININEDPAVVALHVTLDQGISYMSAKHTSPLGVILYLKDATWVGKKNYFEYPENNWIDSIDVSTSTYQDDVADKTHTKLKILLNEDIQYSVSQQSDELIVTFDKPEIQTVSNVENQEETDKVQFEYTSDSNETETAIISQQATQLLDIQSNLIDEDLFSVLLEADGIITEYESFTIQYPPRIVFDIFNVGTKYTTEQKIPINNSFVKNIRHFCYPDRLRVVVDTYAPLLSKYKSESVASGMIISLGEISDKIAHDNALVTVSDQSENINVDSSNYLTDIEFKQLEIGRSEATIRFADSVEYKIIPLSDTSFKINIPNTSIPEFKQKQMHTASVDSIVKSITPMQNKADMNTAMIVFELSHSAPYSVRSDQNTLSVLFEAEDAIAVGQLEEPSTVEPSNVKSSVKMVATTEEAVNEKRLGEDGDDSSYSLGDNQGKKYTGEKIALDFYKTDIKNVFRILREISGKNYAIDKDVAGEVTLAFEKPVPWDQVLDLVLKMNQLGMTHEGDIIRIATLETIRKEEELRQAALMARKRAEEEKKALEPLYTEYIPINYSDASRDIVPHLKEILTEDRGLISVDTRTNQVIMTDTKAKIRQAKSIVNKLDRITPQVLIQAKIVEANTDFSKQLGVTWNAGSNQEGIYRSDLGGQYDYAANMLFPPLLASEEEGDNTIADIRGQMGFTFERIGGTPLVLNAALQALESDGEVKIVSSPRIMTLDNKTAKIKQGVEYPYRSYNDGEITVEFKNIDLLLEVTPHITNDNRVLMQILITKDDLGALVGTDRSFDTKEAATELLVNNGDTIVIGGITKTRDTYSENGFPILSKIPVIGWLFKSTVKDNEKKELIIFITPKIVELEDSYA
ncbi:MAG: hypothetical protein CSA22_05520 [Deltaproteobacteria bacterium]|nr:MAG: hypothetical protein CSA22_05520 [Deltaproteobacteria bacterium]